MNIISVCEKENKKSQKIGISTKQKSQLENTNQRRKWKEHEEACLGGVEPNQIERVEIERRIRTVEDGPGTELSGSKARYDDAGKLGVVAREIAGGDGA